MRKVVWLSAWSGAGDGERCPGESGSAPFLDCGEIGRSNTSWQSVPAHGSSTSSKRPDR